MNNLNELNELEYKYKADNIKLVDFMNLFSTSEGIKKEVSSWDHYYTKSSEDFIRFRNSYTPELTRKAKTRSTNNWNRVEIDLPLDRQRLNESHVEAFVGSLGFTKNFSIYKSCFMFLFDTHNYVYYIVYDENMKERGRFIEVEVNKSSISEFWDAMDFLNQKEEVLRKLGLNPNKRMKRSLFEIFYKE